MLSTQAQRWLTHTGALGVILVLVSVGPAQAQADCDHDDCRGNLAVTVFPGVSIDTFASKDLRNLVNPEASGDVQEQLIAGYDFEFRLAGATPDASAPPPENQLWFFGEIIHGAASGETDCTSVGNTTDTSSSGTPSQALCNDLFTEPSTAQAPSLAVFRQATSLEAYMGLRYEFLRLNAQTEAAASLYLRGSTAS